MRRKPPCASLLTWALLRSKPPNFRLCGSYRFRDPSSATLQCQAALERHLENRMTKTFEHAWDTYGTQLVFVVVTAIIILAPVFRYLRAGWRHKSLDITNSIDDTAKQIYLEKFQKRLISPVGQARTEFYREYHRRFGRRYFVSPTLI
jgi:hypothetical protein